MTSLNPEDTVFIDRLVDLVCDRFEAAWTAGQPVSIEQWVAAEFLPRNAEHPATSPEFEQKYRQALLLELIPLEICIRKQQGDEPSVEEYVKRFSEFTRATIEAWLVRQAIDSEQTKLLSTDAVAPSDDAEERYVGPYLIIEKLGQGGMGEVYRARQRFPIRRDVAIKLIKLGMDTKNVIARFEAERQALALMDHPHIAKVYDAGADQSGRPYFVMEYVRGKPITEYADTHQLNIIKRLGLFQQVCRAIQHAHQKGVIHRDIKPSNILAFTQDGAPQVKVIDFGVAKAVSQPLTDKTLFTLHNQFLGTPQYMSPEQAEGSLDIDTRSDVYGLGVLLYELLTGSTPFSLNELKAYALEKIKKVICEVEPQKPSTRLSGTEPSLTKLATARGTDVQKLSNLLRGELDWIVMMSLEKDRRRRYESPGKLAEDIANFLEGRPVVAAPPSRVYRLQKSARKHRWVLGIGASFICLITIGTVVSWMQTARAIYALKESRQALYYANVALAHREYLANSNESALKLLDEAPKDLRSWEWGYLHRLCHAHLLQWTLADLKFNSATSLAIERHGVRVAVGSETGVAVLNIDDGTVLHRWETEGPVYDVAFSPDGHSLAIGIGTKLGVGFFQAPFPGRALVYDLATGKLQEEFESHLVSALDYGLDNSLIYAIDRQVFSRKNQVQKELANADRDNRGKVESLIFNSSCTRFAEVHNDVANIRNADDGKLLHELMGHTFTINDCAFSPDERFLATASSDSSVVIWDALNGNKLLSFHEHQNGVNAVAFSPDGGFLASGGDDQLICIWDLSGGILRTLRGHSSSIVGLAFAADGRLVSSDESGNVMTWDPTVDPDAFELLHGAEIIGFMSGGRELVTFGDQVMCIWQTNSGIRTNYLNLRTLGQGLWGGMAINSDNKCALIGDKIHVLDTKTFETLFEMPNSYRPSYPDSVAPDLAQFLENEAWFLKNQALFHPDGDLLAIASADAIRLYSLTKRTEVRTLPGAYVVAFSPEGQLLAGGTHDGRLVVWETATGNVAKELSGHTTAIRSIAFHPNGRWIAGGCNEQVRIWDIATGQTLAVLEGHGGSVHCLAFSADGKRLASAGRDRLIRLWETGRWRPVITLSGHTERINSLAFSSNGQTLVSGSSDSTTRMWESSPITEQVDKLRKQVRRTRLSQPMTDDTD